MMCDRLNDVCAIIDCALKIIFMVRLQLLLIDDVTFVEPQLCVRVWNESGGSWHSNSFCRNAFCCILICCAVINIE